MSNDDVSDAFRTVRVTPEQPQNVRYVLGDVLVADLRLTFGRSGMVAGVWGLMSSAAENAHYNTSLTDAVVLPERTAMMSHVRITESWEVG